MKKILILMFGFLTMMGYSQISFGAKAGVNISKMNAIHDGSNKRIGMYAGGFAMIPLSDYGNQFYIQPELLYNMLGEKEGTDDVYEDVNIDYISAPILFKAYFSENDTEFFGEIGPQVGFLINKKLPGSDKNYDYKTLDFGATIGIGFSYLRTWEANARFYYGMMDVVENDAVDGHNYNSNISLGLAYRF